MLIATNWLSVNWNIRLDNEVIFNLLFFFPVWLCPQCIKFSVFDWTHRESDDPYEQEPLGSCEATLAEIVARGGDGQVHTYTYTIIIFTLQLMC